MFRSVNSLKGFSLSATDGDIGSLKSLHFDDRTWKIRYLVVDTGSFFDTKDVLILPTAAYELSWISHNIKVNLTQEQVKNALPFNSDLPISYKHELIRQKNFNALYMADPWSGSLFPMWFPKTDKVNELLEVVGDRDLRCTEVVKGYTVIDKDGKKAGKVKDFIIDDEEWEIRYLIVDTNGVYPLGDVLMSTYHVEGFNIEDKEVSIDMDKHELALTPNYNPHEPVNRDYVLKYYDYEGKLVKSTKANIEEYDELDMKLKS